MTGFYIDTSELQALKHALGATESQMVAAFNKALRQTVSALYKTSVNVMLQTTGAKSRKDVQRRIRRVVQKIGASSRTPGTGRIWFGLSDMPVSALRGQMKSARGIRPQDRKRDALGRFLPARGGHDATFTPAASDLPETTFKNSFLGVVKGHRSIWIRTESGHVHEAKVPVHSQMNSAIEKSVFEGVTDMLMDYFEKDLAGRVRGGVHLDQRGKRA